jgi:ABC-2 type transport system permease protein
LRVADGGEQVEAAIERTQAAPSALPMITVGQASGSQLQRSWEIAWVIAKADLKQRYLGSFFGFAWTLIRPLLLYAVLYVVFSHIGKSSTTAYYPVYLLMTFTFWGFFAEITTVSVTSLVARESILRKIKIPIFSIPLSALILAAVQFGASLIVLFLFVALSGVDPQLGWLMLPVFMLAITAFGAAVGWLLAIAYVYFRDVGPVWEVVSQVLFWATPIIYVALFLPRGLRNILAVNPLSPMFSLMRKLLIDNHAPGLTQLYSTTALIVSGAVFVGVIVAGPLVFRRFAPMITEKL